MPATASFILSEQQSALLDALSAELEHSSLLWASGYLAGLAVSREGGGVLPAQQAPVAAPVEQQTLTILYGSQTGNAKRFAERFAAESEAGGLKVNLVDAADYSNRQLKKETHLVVVISTQGDGEPPDGARDFFEFLHGKKAPKLNDLSYTVLALGDASYPDFCTIGKRVDTRLEELGGKRFKDRGDCDLDIETVAEPWWEATLGLAKEELAVDQPQQSATVTPLRPSAAASAFNRDKPFAAELLDNQRITASDTDKDIRHIELSLEDSGLTYKPGDSVGIWHTNPTKLVDDVLAALQLDGDTKVTHKDDTLTLREWLRSKREITNLARPFLIAHNERANHDDLTAALAEDGREKLVDLLNNYQVVDVLRQFPTDWTAEDVVASLRPLVPRLYSIASSQEEVEEEVHLTVARVAYNAHDEEHIGAASNFLATVDDDAELHIYIEENKQFRLPEDGKRDVIMVGPGTGVAPFRAFVQERAVTEAEGRNWLFFGAQHFQSQFLYQTEWQQALKKGELDRLDLAFSRDQEDKVYVQHKVVEQGAELYSWLEGGASLYVCGAIEMEKDVKAALQQVIAEHGSKNAEEAADYVTALQKDGRYNRDVY